MVKIEKILEKINSYHIFTNLVPGYLFLIISGYILNKKLLINNILSSFFVAYFIGVIISRLSSLVIERLINKIWNLKKEPYDRYIEASEKDSKIEILNQDCNMYRSLCTLMIIELALKVIIMFNISNLINMDIIILLLFLALSILFAFSFVKQNKYILSRVKKISKNKKENKRLLH